jgi:hypothetical protein
MRNTVFVIILLFLAITIGGGIFLRNSLQQGNIQQAIVSSALSKDASATSTALVQRALGMNGKRKYLILFLNNTELRPGGGFIGSYGVVSVENGRPTILKVEGTESLDNAAASIGIEPYAPLAKYLGIKKMQLRDSNWSPDFPTNAKLAMQMYRNEGGVNSTELDGIVAVTPTLFEEILKITGPIKVGDIEFTSENFTEKLEYEVEYGYKNRGKDFSERKNLLGELSKAMLPRLIATSFTHWKDYLQLVPRMLKEKQMILYSIYEDERNFLSEQSWDGSFLPAKNDYLLWADANLGSLKTDVAIQRSLNYSISPSGTDRLVAVASMRYNHTGGFTWRTTRYRDYVRIFVPRGSKLIGVQGVAEGSTVSKKLQADEGDEGSYHWFGTFISVEPGKQGSLAFNYILPQNILESVKNGEYNLVVQKQSGTLKNRLTLDLNFGKKLIRAVPAENTEKFGDSRYEITTDLGVDREFNVSILR